MNLIDHDLLSVETEECGHWVQLFPLLRVSDSSQNKKVKRRKTNNPPDLPFLVLVLGETPQQILLLTDR